MARWKTDLSECSFKASEFDRDQLENLVEVLTALGVKVECEVSSSGKTAQIKFSELPDKFDAKVKRTRNAGRRSTRISLPKSSVFKSETTCAEFLTWLDDGHTAEEAMEQLGLSRSTYFRRLKAIREKVEWERVHNPERVKKGMGELHNTLGDVR